MPEQRRVRFLRLSVEDLPDNPLSARVELEWLGVTYQGTADVVWQENAEFICAAKATCSALEAVLQRAPVSFEYLKCEPTTAVGRLLAVAAVSVEAKDGAQYTVGVCPVGDDPADAAVRAVLSATNREVSRLLS
jgi:hypothetical protein